MPEERVWSHSSLNLIMKNPAEFFLNYICGIKPKIEKTALSLGSAVHWGLEHNTTDLTEYYNEKGSFKQWNNYTEEQLLAECMVGAYFRDKSLIYEDILKDVETGGTLEILDETHELQLTADIPSLDKKEKFKFLGIIDLLFLTDKGWILIDYKTSSKEVDYDDYKSQLFKYFILLEANFPEVPIYKIGIINLKKTGIRRKKGENDESFKRRIKMEYDLEENKLIEHHIYFKEEFKDEQISNALIGLSKQIEVARTIERNNLFFVNYSNIIDQYGKSQYYDLFYKTKDNYFLYIVRDHIYDEDEKKVIDYRDCEPIDMMVLDTDRNRILNSYKQFKEIIPKYTGNNYTIPEKEIIAKLKKEYICSDKLLDKYFLTYNKGF